MSSNTYKTPTTHLSMDYLQLLKEKLKEVENSSELLSLLSKAELELKNETKELDKKLKQLIKAFGDDESEYPEKAKKLAEYDIIVSKLEAANEKLEAAKKENKLLARDNALTKQCSQLGIDQDALKVLLDDSLDITEDGVLVDGKAIPLDKYIAKDAKLSKFTASLFIQKESSEGAIETPTTPLVDTQLPKTKGQSKAPQADDLDSAFNQYVNKYWSGKNDKIKNKLGK